MSVMGAAWFLTNVYHRLDILPQIEATVQEWKSLLKSRKEVVEMESFETALEEPLADVEGWRLLHCLSCF